MRSFQNDKKKIEDSGISKYQNEKLQSSQEERHIKGFHFLTCETSHKKKNDEPHPPNDKKKNEDLKTSKYQNKRPSKFTRRNANTPISHLVKFDTNFF
jgi:hypothetical protein